MFGENNTTKNPVKKWIEFKGGEGKFTYYDKVKGENIEIEQPITFVVLDERATIKGWSDEHQCSIWSNEVLSTRNEELFVRAGKNEIVTGFYADIKGDLGGGRYAKSIYANFNGELVNISLKGASLGAWIEKEVDTNKNQVTCKDVSEEKKGSIKFKKPIFEAAEMKDDVKIQSLEMVKELKEYWESKKMTPRIEDNNGIDGIQNDEGTSAAANRAIEEMQNAENAAEDIEIDSMPF